MSWLRPKLLMQNKKATTVHFNAIKICTSLVVLLKADLRN